MGCTFFACFSAREHKKCKHLENATPPKQHGDEALKVDEPTKQEEVTEEPIKLSSESRGKLEKQLSCSEKKKVTFDLNVRTYEDLSTETEVANDGVPENNEARECEKKEEEEEEPSNVNQSVSNLFTSNEGSHLPSYRYQNFANKEENEDLDLEDDSELDAAAAADGVDLQVSIGEESSESLFSLSIDSRKRAYGAAELGEKEVTSPMPKSGLLPKEEKKEVGSEKKARDRSLSDDSVLNPVENITQWKVTKARTTSPQQNEDKENINVEQDFDRSISQETGFKPPRKDSQENTSPKKPVDQEIAVDTSLSSWLDTTPMSKGSATSVGNSPSARMSSPTSHEDRPILGALTLEELKQHSASNTPRKPRNRSPDETPILGTVGRYWIHTGRVVDSDSGSSSKGMRKTKKDEGTKWNSTPFEERLERALETARV